MTTDTGFYFDKKTHRYYLDGKQMTGVTAVLGVLAKPALIQWAANCAVDHIWQNTHRFLGEVNQYNEAEFLEICEEARTAHAQKRDKSADVGTLAHRWCEKWIKGENPQPDPALALITDNFVRWATEKKVKFLESEKVVWSKKLFVAGTMDFIAEIDGRIYLGDLKTGNGIYREHFLQTAAYQLLLQEQQPDYKIDGHIIINCTKNGKLNTEEYYDFAENERGFLAALTLYRLLNNS